MAIWTLASDESGEFQASEPHAFLVGGALVPGAAEQVEDLRTALQSWCTKNHVEYPPHATAHRQAGRGKVVEELIALGSSWLTAHQGFFVGVLCKPSAIKAEAS